MPFPATKRRNACVATLRAMVSALFVYAWGLWKEPCAELPPDFLDLWTLQPTYNTG